MARELLYKRAETEMRRRITEGDWAVGTRLGNEFELADEFQVSQGTMRRALMSLEADGLLSRKPGRGTIVAAVAAQGPAAAPAGQLRDADGAEAAFEIHRTKSTVRTAEGAEAEVFGETRLHHAERLLKFAGERAALEEITLPIDLAPEFDDSRESQPDRSPGGSWVDASGCRRRFERGAHLDGGQRGTVLRSQHPVALCDTHRAG